MSESGKYAAATPPLSTTIHTDATGLSYGDISIPTADGAIPGWYAAPEGAVNPPVVLVILEIFGVHEHIRDIARRFAQLGYMAVAPALHVRQGDTSRLAEMPAIMAVISQVPDAQVMADLDAAVRWAAAHGGDTGRLGAAGFCWGGRMVWLYAAQQPLLKAGLAWYGKLASTVTPLQPRSPLELAGQLQAPVLGLYGGADHGISPESIAQMQAALAAAGGQSRIQVYADAPHAFLADYRPSYRREAAEDSWQRGLDWLRQHGV